MPDRETLLEERCGSWRITVSRLGCRLRACAVRLEAGRVVQKYGGEYRESETSPAELMSTMRVAIKVGALA